MFQRIDPKHAGPTALGILVPQGTRTLVVVRPRALAWDLLPAHWDGDAAHPPRFCAFTRDEAAGVARRLIDALESAVADGVNPVQTFGDADGTTVQVWVRAAGLVWIACARTPGQAYQPIIFSSREDAVREAESIASVLWPAENVTQEIYINTQRFS